MHQYADIGLRTLDFGHRILNQNPKSPVLLDSPCSHTGSITSNFTTRQYVTKHNVSCKSNNIIYCITCKKCKKQYVGQTKLRLMDRFQGHFWCIQSKTLMNDVSKHFNLPGHKGIEDIEIHILDFIHLHPNFKEALYIRNHVEMNWIHRLHTQQPIGMNTMDAPPRHDPQRCRAWEHYRR